MTTFTKSKNIAIRASRARLRLEQLRQHSASGSTKEQAAEAIGMTVAGVNSLLFAKEGTTTWPIA